MKKIFIAGLIILLVCVICIPVFTGERDNRHDYIPFPSDLMPYNKFPQGAACEFPPISSEMVCVRGEWYISYDYAHGKLMSIATYVEFKNITVGDVINAWGIPDGIYISSYETEIKWGYKFVSTNSKNFSPTSIVHLAGWEDYDRGYKPWSGFTAR